MLDRIESPGNARVKEIVRLRKRSERDATRRFVVEGSTEVARALEAGVTARGLYIAGDNPSDRELATRARNLGIAVIETSAAAFAKMAYRDSTSGVILVADQFETGLDQLPLPDSPLLLVVESIEKPGNLGTMLRTAEGAGVDGLVVCDAATDLFNPNVVRASLGTLFWVPVALASTAETLLWLRSHAIRSVGTTPSAETTLYEVDLTGPVAIVIGAEHDGLSDQWLSATDESALIPMLGRAESLNAAVSAAVLLYEAVRQRSS